MKTNYSDHPIRTTIARLALASTMGAAIFFGTSPASAADGLNVSHYLGSPSESLLDPIANLMALTPNATGTSTATIDFHGGTWALPGSPSGDDFSVLWEGWFDVTKDGLGVYTFGTSSDDGSVVYLDLNDDGDFADAGERIVNNNNFQGDNAVTAEVDLQMNSVRMVIGYYQGGGGYDMRAAFKKGTGLGFGDLDLINSSTDYFFTEDPYAALDVKLTSPENSVALISGSTLTASANVKDPGAFTHTVTFHVTPTSPAGPTITMVDSDSPYTADFPSLADGAYEIYATVLNSNSETATSTTRTFTIAPAESTSTIVVSSGTPTTYGQNVTFTATISPTPNGGTVQFFDGGNYLGTPVPVIAGQASVSTTTLGVGTHEITADYSGYQIYESSSTGDLISHEVEKATLTVAAQSAYRTINSANPDPLPYQITGFQNSENLATSGVTGTPSLTTTATPSSPVGPYVITCALGTLASGKYNFTFQNGTLTITDLVCPLGVLNLGANGGINPATGNPWALGDTYRLIFVTGSTIACDSTDIATYNNFVQGLADASTAYPNLGNTTWKVVGSTATVAARDNTNTNPSVDGVGEPIIRMDGLFVIANNYADLWNGDINSSHSPGQNYLAIHLDENGVERLDERVRNGTLNDGSSSDNPLGIAGNVQTGRTYTPDFYNFYVGWVQDWSEPAADPGRVYAMSGVLTLQSVGGGGFTAWADANGATDQDPDQDHDNDGVQNGIEYFMGETGSSFTLMPSLDANNMISWPASAAYQGTYEVQTSPDLATWTNVDPRPVPSGGLLNYTLPPGAPGGKSFVRLFVTPTP